MGLTARAQALYNLGFEIYGDFPRVRLLLDPRRYRRGAGGVAGGARGQAGGESESDRRHREQVLRFAFVLCFCLCSLFTVCARTRGVSH